MKLVNLVPLSKKNSVAEIKNDAGKNNTGNVVFKILTQIPGWNHLGLDQQGEAWMSIMKVLKKYGIK